VDIDPGAIEIARLRFWLSLVVDAKTPEPLPNLDYKLYCADSLIERVRGEPVNVGTKTPNDPQLRTEIEKLVQAKHKLYIAHSKPDKRQARYDLYSALGSLAEIELAALRNNTHFTDEEFGRIVTELEDLKRLLRDVRKNQEILAKKKGGGSVVDLDRALSELQQWFEDSKKPTFLWQLQFGEIFTDGGFHIVIENPPYVRHETISQLAPLLRAHYQVAASRADLFVFFYERSVQLLREGGVLSIISSNKYFRSAYGKQLRAYLTKQANVADPDRLR
jgi:hypothetical protein